MATIAPRPLVAVYTALERSGQYPSLRRGGIVGDAAHTRRATYHVSRQDQPYTNGNYTLQAPADKRGPSNLASAIDITMNRAGMRKMSQRLLDACRRNHANPSSEPRIEPLREFFGCVNGSTVIGWNRYPSANRGVGPSSSDTSHRWHVHASLFRAYADDAEAIRGIVDIMLGVPLNRPAPPAPKPPEKEEDMPLTDAEISKIASAVLTAKIGTGAVDDWTLRHLVDWTARTSKAQGDVLGNVVTMLGQISSGQKVAQSDLDEVQAALSELTTAEPEPDPDDPEVLASQAAADRGEREDTEPPA